MAKRTYKISGLGQRLQSLLAREEASRRSCRELVVVRSLQKNQTYQNLCGQEVV
jgi:hypothetical protein